MFDVEIHVASNPFEGGQSVGALSRFRGHWCWCFRCGGGSGHGGFELGGVGHGDELFGERENRSRLAGLWQCKVWCGHVYIRTSKHVPTKVVTGNRLKGVIYVYAIAVRR